MTPAPACSRPALWLAGLRMAALAGLALAAIAADGELVHDTAFSIAFVLAAAYTLSVLALSVMRPVGPPGGWRPYFVLDLALLALLAHVTGGAASEARHWFLVPPLAAALLGSPRDTATAIGGSMGAYLVVALSHPATEWVEGHAFMAAQLLLLALGGALVLALSRLLELRGRREVEISASHDRLISHALETEDRERRRLAHELHDDAVQNLLASRSAIRRVRRGDLESLDVVEEAVEQTTNRLRDAIFELHPPELEHLSLQAAIAEMAALQARLADLSVELDVDPAAAGPHDRLLISLSRELLSNAIRHARASRVWLRIARRYERVVLEVEDDGLGIDLRGSATAVEHGHIGLASCKERVLAFGGNLSIETPSGGGTLARVELPARRHTDHALTHEPLALERPYVSAAGEGVPPAGRLPGA